MLSIDKKSLQTFSRQWLPAISIVLFILIIPPIGFAIILAFFSAPLVNSLISLTKLPAFLATLIVMSLLAFLLYSFIFLLINGLISVIWAIEDQLILILEMVDVKGWNINDIAENLIQSSHEAVEGFISFFQKFFQQLFSTFMFIIAFFFALRESATNRFWFLVYFPKNFRTNATRVFSKASRLMGHFFSVQLRLFFVTFVLMSIGFRLLQFESYLTKAFLLSLVDSIPFLGIGLVFLPMIAFTFYIENLQLAVGLLILYIILLVTRQMTESYLWAHTFKLRTVHSFLITACAVYLFGIYGVLFLPFFLFLALKIKEHPTFT
ncbi:AI-2E family transporter [Sporosarcina sp. PTS2304]|uniref:AI-2E family transporter n=1 Tax=Sporosarcina sp. PTS2304 TaxID=2283194 RepID=UPI000E0DFFA8|nr:AI-2E family transporter [Sporosarcina sp. PTS2304]AXH99447.1 AI-2E family transporter [Sporosarcina sp. PTS2304]